MRFGSLSIAALLLIASSGCTRPGQDDSIAQVNGRRISVRDFLMLFESLKPKEIALSGHDRSEMKNLVIKSLVRRAVILTEAETRKMSLSDKELAAGIEKYKQGYTASGFQESLLEQMVDEKEWKEQVRQNLLIEKMFESTAPELPKPTLKEALQFYEQNTDLFNKKAQATALHIAVNDPKVAADIHKKLTADPKAFVSLARAHSVGPEAQEDCKITIEKNTMPEELDRALFEGKLNEISPVIHSPYGYHILKVIHRNPSLNRDFEEVKAEIVDRLVEEKKKAWLLRFEEKLLREASIEYNRNLIGKL
jgi:parvulin-like peptidyl-prolyl isomerase